MAGARRRARTETGWKWTSALALLLFLIWTWTSWARWADFSYRTFDLAYYVQAIWQLLHGRFAVSVQFVPLLGNHVEPIVFLFAPFFFVCPHPMLFVVLQNTALAVMAPVGYGVARQLRLNQTASALLGSALLLLPATGFVALHEFHPEALAAPFLLLMLGAQVRGQWKAYGAWFIAVLACKENMALLLAAYCFVQAITARGRSWREVRRWYLWPLLVACGWFVFSSKVITPALNSGNIDYLALYDRLGSSGGEIVRNFFSRPSLALEALRHSLTAGNLLPGLLLPLLFLPLLRPKWLFVALPILLQHLLSWRSSEWTIYFHYAAPLLPLFWLATVEAIQFLQDRFRAHGKVGPALAASVVGACLIGQFVLGPAGNILRSNAQWLSGRSERARKQYFIDQIPAAASVVAPLPYLSHLAKREELHSLHYILKGLKTLSRAPFQPPPPTEFVLLDYADDATFDQGAGYYHPRMRAQGGKIFPSSDQLLHNFLRQAHWRSQSRDSLTLLQRTDPPLRSVPAEGKAAITRVGDGVELLKIEKSTEKIRAGESFQVRSEWRMREDRESFPWLLLQLQPTSGGQSFLLSRGLIGPEVKEGIYLDDWLITATSKYPAGNYQVRAILVDRSRTTPEQSEGQLLASPIALGELEIAAP